MNTTETLSVPFLWCNLARAWDIAELGDHTITVLYDDDYSGAEGDYALMLDYYGPERFTPEGGDLLVEIFKPKDYHRTPKKAETKPDIIRRVDEARKRPAPACSFDSLTPASHALLGSATDRLGLSAQDNAKILDLARTIAWLAGRDVSVEHVAEAISYRSVFSYARKYLTAAGGGPKRFGPYIAVLPGLDAFAHDQIKDAIAYLQGKL